MKVTLRKMGSSLGIVIPKTLITQFGFDKEIEILVTETGIILQKPKTHPREGWDEACKALSDEPIDHEWLDFGNDFDDEEWTW